MVGIFNGTTSPIQQGWRVKWAPSVGGQSEIRNFGFDVEQMLAIAGEQAAAGIEVELAYEHNTAELTLRSSNPTYQGFGNVFNSVSDKWEISVDDEKPPLFENPSYLSLFTTANAIDGINIDQQFAQLIKQSAESGSGGTWSAFVESMQNTNLTNNDGSEYLENGVPGATVPLYTIFLNKLDPPSNLQTISGQLGLQFFAQEYFRGRTQYLHSKYTLRHTTLAPDTYSSNVADFNVEQIYSIAELLTEVQDAALWILPLPDYLAYKILNYPIPVNMPPLYTWGALKTRSNAVVAARGRIELTQSYLIDAVAVPTYGLIS